MGFGLIMIHLLTMKYLAIDCTALANAYSKIKKLLCLVKLLGLFLDEPINCFIVEMLNYQANFGLVVFQVNYACLNSPLF